MSELKYKRILLKVSGEALGGEMGRGLDFDVIEKVCDVVARCAGEGVQVGIVVGGGNFWRGLKDGRGMSNRTRADHMGMLATVINSWPWPICWSGWAWTCGCRPPLRCAPLPSPMSAPGPSAIWRRDG